MTPARPIVGTLALAAVAAALIAPRPARADELWFHVTAAQRFEHGLAPDGSVTTEPDAAFEPVQFTLRVDVDPVFRYADDTGDMGGLRTITSWFQGPSYAGTAPFDAEMDACNTFGLANVDLSPWYHLTRACEMWQFTTPPTGHVAAQVQYALSSEVSPGSNKMYHHLLCLGATNPTLAVPPAGPDEMAPWTRSQLVAFMTHPDTVWQFTERAWSEDGVVQGDQLILDYYHGVTYTGPAELIPEPATFFLLCVGAALAGRAAAPAARRASRRAALRTPTEA